jgi:hypothetical protein
LGSRLSQTPLLLRSQRPCNVSYLPVVRLPCYADARWSLSERLHALVCNKISCYHYNHGKHLSNPDISPESDSLSSSDESTASEDAEYDDNYTRSSYLLPQSNRIQGQRGTTRPINRKNKFPAPTACMVCGQNSMGNTQVNLESTSPPYSRHYLTSRNDRMGRGGRSRPTSSFSYSVSELTSFTSDADPTSPAWEPHEGSSGFQDDTIEVKANGASKRALQVESPATDSRKRRHTREVPHTREDSYPRRRLIVKLKLTQEKMLHGTQRLHSVSASSVPATVTTPQLSTGRTQQYQVQYDSTADSSPNQDRHGPRYSLQPSVTDEPEDIDMHLPQYNHRNPPQSDESASTSKTGTRINTVEEVDEDRSYREQSPVTVPDMAERLTFAAREAASKASEALRVFGLERIGCEARGNEGNAFPTAALSQGLADDSRQPIVPRDIPTAAPTAAPTPAPSTQTNTTPAQVTALNNLSPTKSPGVPSTTLMPLPAKPAIEPVIGLAAATSTGPLNTHSTTAGIPPSIIPMPPPANTAPTAARIASSDSAQPTTAQSPSAKIARLTNNIRMLLKMKRDLDPNAQKVRLFSLENVVTSSDLFATLQNEVEELLDAGERIVRVDVKWLSDPPTAELMTDFIMTPKAAVRRDRSWDSLLEGLQDQYDETGEFVKLKLEATVLVRRALDEKP